MSYQSYFESPQNTLTSDVDKVVEELDIIGFSVVENVISKEKIKAFQRAVNEAWQIQIEETGKEKLKALNEWGTVRALIYYDDIFAELIRHPLVMGIVSKTIGETAILHLINSSISYPDDDYHQGLLHRDFAKNFSSDKMLSINAFWILDPFDMNTGGTWFVPFTHKISYTPSDEFIKKHAIQLNASPGAVVFFDSRIYHKAGLNTSKIIRRGINTQYTKPFIKQQIDLPEFLKDKFEKETPLGQTLGMWSVPPKSVKEFRVDPGNRTYKPGQG